jgi:hypothetical protein
MAQNAWGRMLHAGALSQQNVIKGNRAGSNHISAIKSWNDFIEHDDVAPQHKAYPPLAG